MANGVLYVEQRLLGTLLFNRNAICSLSQGLFSSLGLVYLSDNNHLLVFFIFFYVVSLFRASKQKKCSDQTKPIQWKVSECLLVEKTTREVQV